MFGDGSKNVGNYNELIFGMPWGAGQTCWQGNEWNH